MQMIYMDNAATSFPKAAGVSNAMKAFMDNDCCNIGRGSYERAQQTGLSVFETREMIRDFFDCPSAKHVIFTGGMTASLNTVIKGFVRQGDRVLISSMEHNSVVRPLVQTGAQIVRIPATDDGVSDLSKLPDDLSGFRLCIHTHASNVCGSIQPVEELGRRCKASGLPFVLDAAQTAGHFPFSMKQLHLSALCMPAHKGLLAAQGLGILCLDPYFASELEPLISGGTGSFSYSELIPEFYPDRFEAGTLNLPGIIGLLESLKTSDFQRTREHELKLIELFANLIADIPDIRVSGSLNPSERVGVFSVDFIRHDNAEISDRLEREYGILTRCGLHCAPDAHRSLHTFPKGSVRFSFSPFTTEQEIRITAQAIRESAS